VNLDVKTSRHARTRMQQRAVPPLVVQWLAQFGARQRARDAADLVFFDKAARRRLTQAFGEVVVQRLGPLLNAYIVQAENGDVVTVGWRLQRVLRDLQPGQRADRPSN